MSKEILAKIWALGFKDRGLGHGDFGIIVKDTNDLVAENIDRDVAEHVIKIHNKSLKEVKS